MIVNTPFFISPAYSRAQDDQLAALEVEGDAGLAGDACDVADRRETGRRCRSRSRARRTSASSSARGPDQHVVHEQGVVRPRADDADLEPMRRVPAGEAVDDVEPRAAC